jgi:hypothetical protein
MSRPQAPIALVFGHIKLFVNDAKLLPAALAALAATPRDQPAASGSVLGTLAEASSVILAAAAAAHPTLRFRSLRDVVFELRHEIDSPTAKFAKDLNSCYAFVRHLPQSDILAKARAAADSITAAACTAHDSAAQSQCPSGGDDVSDDHDLRSDGGSGDSKAAVPIAVVRNDSECCSRLGSQIIEPHDGDVDNDDILESRDDDNDDLDDIRDNINLTPAPDDEKIPCEPKFVLDFGDGAADGFYEDSRAAELFSDVQARLGHLGPRLVRFQTYRASRASGAYLEVILTVDGRTVEFHPLTSDILGRMRCVRGDLSDVPIEVFWQRSG